MFTLPTRQLATYYYYYLCSIESETTWLTVVLCSRVLLNISVPEKADAGSGDDEGDEGECVEEAIQTVAGSKLNLVVQ